ncbi:MAG: DUF192 domain-containing protein [Candidatus Aenigmarchaeota archaeon]|nr:DUF192 domain-containing protein [Candidatus Aenigmarchaeota archaeon]
MKRGFLIVAALVLLLFVAGIKPSNEKIIYFSSGGKNVTLLVTVADIEETRAKGLMFVKTLGENEGMLFVFPDESVHTFWMKNTPISLDMVFVASNGTVVGLIEGATPCEKDPCETYSVDADSKYVVEVNAGFVKKNEISLGAILYQ